MPGVVERIHPPLRHVVFVSCAIPPDGGSLLDLLLPEIVEIVENSTPSPEGTALPPNAVRTMQCYDMDEAQTAFTLEVVVPEAYWPVRDIVSLDGLRHPVPRTWLKLMRDQTFPPPPQDEMARRSGCGTVTEIDSGHMAMISHPHQLATALKTIHAGA